MRRLLSISFLFAFLITLFPADSLYSQSSLSYGIKWDVPDEESRAKKELTLFQQTGITHLMVEGIVPYNLMDIISAFDFDITVQLPYIYIIEDEFRDHYLTIAEDYKDYSIYYDEFSDVTALSLFYVADLSNENLYNLLPELAKIYPTRFDLTYVQIPALNSSAIASDDKISPVWLTIAPRDMKHEHVSDSKRFILFEDEEYSYSHLSRFIEQTDGGLIYLTDAYFWSGLEAELPVDSVISATIQDANKLFDRTSEKKENEYPNLIIFSLVFTILIFGVHYGFEPNYRKSLSRYFGAHIFFVDDIGERRIRLGTSLLLVMLVQALLFAIAKTFFLQYTLTPLQHEILTSHLPWLTFASTTFFGSLILNGVVMLLFMLICGLWIYLAFPTLQQIYQSFLLFLWPLHLTIPVVFLYVISVLTNVSEFLSASLIVLYLIIVFGSFILTFFDMIRIEKKTSLPVIYLTTFIPYLIILSVVLLYLFPSFYIYDLIGMIFSL